MDVHNVKERGANGAIVTRLRLMIPARARKRVLPAHETRFDVVRLNLRSICPPAVPAEGGACAGYSGLRIRPCSARCIGFEKPRYARAPTNRRSQGRLNPAGTALSAVAICDALNSIGASVGALKLLQRAVCLIQMTSIVKRRERNSVMCLRTERLRFAGKRRRLQAFPPPMRHDGLAASDSPRRR